MRERLFRALALLLPALALAVIVFGAYVRLTDAGLGCPDWPGCYGHLTVPDAGAGVHRQDPDWAQRPLDAGKAWREMIHRYLASTLGLGIVLMAFAAHNPGRRGRSNVVPWLLVPLVVFQGLLGMWTVTLLLKPLVVTAHLIGGITTLALLWWNLLDSRGAAPPPGEPRVFAAAGVALAVLAGQVFLGGWTSANYAALACTDFPTCQGRWWPETDFGEAFVLWRGLGVDYEFGVLETPARTAVHLTHRIGAVVTALAVLWAAVAALRSPARPIRRAGAATAAVLVVQLALGITNVLRGLPLAVAVAHNGGAALLVVALVGMLYLARGTNGGAP